jgi:hypothetical protein
MSKCAAIEPAPNRFYAPAGLFSTQELSQLGAEWLGEFITSPLLQLPLSSSIRAALQNLLGQL